MNLNTIDNSTQSAGLTQTELALVTAFRAMNSAGRDYLQGMARQLGQSFPAGQSKLRVVGGAA